MLVVLISFAKDHKLLPCIVSILRLLTPDMRFPRSVSFLHLHVALRAVVCRRELDYAFS